MTPLQRAIATHRDHFGYPPRLEGLRGIGRNRELAHWVWAAVNIGTQFDPEAVALTWKLTIPLVVID